MGPIALAHLCLVLVPMVEGVWIDPMLRMEGSFLEVESSSAASASTRIRAGAQNYQFEFAQDESSAGGMLNQVEMLQKMQKEIGKQEVIIRREEDYANKLASKIEQDETMQKANADVFRNYQYTLEQQTDKFKFRMKDLKPETYVNDNNHMFVDGVMQKANYKKPAPMKSKKKKKGFFKKLIGGVKKLFG